jgi:hypothetical protein
MLLDFEVQRSTRRCAATNRALEPGDLCYSMLELQGADVVRKDFCVDAWQGAPPAVIGWWKTRIPEPIAKKIKLAPNEVLLNLFDELADHHEQLDLRYVLTLLLLRRRVLRMDVPPEELGLIPVPAAAKQHVETMFVYCPKRDASYEVVVAMPAPPRIDEIQQQLSDLLVAGAE